MIPGKLGSLVPQTKYLSTELGMMRLDDWHKVSEFLLNDLSQMQKSECLHWHYKGKLMRLHIPVMFIIGDIEGHDKLCTRKSGHGANMKGVTHSCNIAKDKCDSVSENCKLLTRNEISSSQKKYKDTSTSKEERQRLKNVLDSLGFYANVSNAFFDLDYGSNPNGLHGACAICLLHTFKQKYPDLLLHEYMNLFGVSEVTSGSLKVNSSLPRFMAQHCKRQSDRDLPRLNTFSFSLTKGKYTYNANEKYARIFSLFLYSMTTFGWRYMMKEKKKEYSEDEVKKLMKVMEKTLTIYQLLYVDEFPHVRKIIGQSEVKKYMRELKWVLEKGHQVHPQYKKNPDKKLCRFPKFHYLKHVIPMILEYGSALNFDGGPNESNHKYLSKAPAKRSQGRTDTFDEQTSYNLACQIVLNQACRETELAVGHKGGTIIVEDKGTEKNFIVDVHKQSSKFCIECVIDGEDYSTIIQWKKSQKKPKSHYSPEVIDFVKDQLFLGEYGIMGSSIPGFTCLKWRNDIIRAHPCYRTGGQWFDFANVKWEGLNENYICPSKILMWLDCRNVNFKREGQPGSLAKGIYAVVQSTHTDEKTNKPLKDARNVHKARGGSRIVRYWTMENVFRLVHVSCIVSVAFVVQDCIDADMTVPTKFVMEILPKKKWAELHYENK